MEGWTAPSEGGWRGGASFPTSPAHDPRRARPAAAHGRRAGSLVDGDAELHRLRCAWATARSTSSTPSASRSGGTTWSPSARRKGTPTSSRCSAWTRPRPPPRPGLPRPGGRPVPGHLGRGRKLADIRVQNREDKPPGGVYLANAKGNIRVERLKIGRWVGAVPDEVEPGTSYVRRVDGSIVRGDDDRLRRTVEVDGRAKRRRHARRDPDRAGRGLRRRPRPARRGSTGRHGAHHHPRTARGSPAGSRRSRTARSGWHPPGSSPPLKIPAGCDPLPSRRQAGRGPRGIPGTTGRPRTRRPLAKGHLLDAERHPDGSCLVWKPFASVSSSPLRDGIAGRIVYTEVKTTAPAPTPATSHRSRRGPHAAYGRSTAGSSRCRHPSRPNPAAA